MFERWLGKTKPPLTGAPEVRRLKTYSAQSGYVYQYYYQGKRPYAKGIEFVFDVSADRRNSSALSVFVWSEAVSAWQTAYGRDLGSNEMYAVAKMALFQAFDERPDPASMRHEIHVRPADLEGFLASLGIE